MPLRIFSLILLLMATACSGDDSASESCASGKCDEFDGGFGVGCNPVSQVGCGDDEKCAQLDITSTISQVACVPNGTLAAGEECAKGIDGPETGFDNCAAGNECVFDRCRESCSWASPEGAPHQGTCGVMDNGLPGTCAPFNGIYESIASAGLCLERCTQPGGDECGEEGFGCNTAATIVHAGSSQIITELYTSCARPLTPEVADPDDADGFCGGQGCDCGDPDDPSVPCSLNWCAEGFGSYGVDRGDLDHYRSRDPENRRNLTFNIDATCTRFCAPHAAFLAGESTDDANRVGDANQGPICNPGFECRYLGGFDDIFLLQGGDTLTVPNEVGICVETSKWGTCDRDVNGVDPADYWNSLLLVPGTEEVIDADAIETYVPGCFTYADMVTSLKVIQATIGGEDFQVVRNRRKEILDSMPTKKGQLEKRAEDNQGYNLR